MHIRVRYGLTTEAFDALALQQHGRCALCPALLSAIKRIVVDHDHATGRVRGLLCDRCNGRLRGVEEPGFVRAALDYLAKPSTGLPGGHGRQRAKAFPTLHAKQGGKCAICPRPISTVRGKGSSAVDHSHQTGEIRALLCWRCNLDVAGVEDSPWLARALEYVA